MRSPDSYSPPLPLRCPLLRTGEIVETIPGVVATQHSGGGKANQYFLRGFNLDHGTDLRLEVDGMPVNMPTHGHGQGYADLNFLIPELIDSVQFRKGTYFAKLNGLLRYSRSRPRTHWSLTAMGYDGDWQSSDQIPRRTLGTTVSPFGFVDPYPNGNSGRYSLSGEFHWHGDAALTTLGAYWIAYDLTLVSNFTYCLEYGSVGECLVDDDQFLQTDDRDIYGIDLVQSRTLDWGGRSVFWRYGLEAQYHAIDNGLARAAAGELRPDGVIASYEVQQSILAAFSDIEIQWTDKARMLAGIRGDYYDADVATQRVVNSGRRDDSIWSPKLSLILGPWSRTEVYLNWGQGFHSNDARGWVATVDPVSLESIDPADPLVKARGADIGARTTLFEGLQSTLTLYRLELDSELVYLGDAAATEPGPPSRRTGVELTNFYRIRPWISLDFDLTLNDAEFTDVPAGEREIPGSIGRTVQLGLALGRPLGWFGTLRWRYFGDIPLTEDGSVRGQSSSLVNGRLGYGFRNGIRLIVEGFNLLDRRDPDIQYYYASRLPAELSPSGQTEPIGGIDDIHLHPMESRSIRFWVEYGR